ncbi:hypothetical protein DY000_02002705 [Brassica cretica]|uniref:Uncharacterized protein n=1 Tax=Brassica cretica TaxID=69181 RepID=A0ABQ7CLE8_BRACR|nr:hypothetical protein DY000_02002705 [Brassica cretica]
MESRQQRSFLMLSRCASAGLVRQSVFHQFCRMTWLVRLLAPWSIQTILSRIGDATSSPSGVCLEARLTACISHFWWSEREVVYAKVLVPQESYSLLWPLQFMADFLRLQSSKIFLFFGVNMRVGCCGFVYHRSFDFPRWQLVKKSPFPVSKRSLDYFG